MASITYRLRAEKHVRSVTNPEYLLVSVEEDIDSDLAETNASTLTLGPPIMGVNTESWTGENEKPIPTTNEGGTAEDKFEDEFGREVVNLAGLNNVVPQMKNGTGQLSKDGHTGTCRRTARVRRRIRQSNRNKRLRNDFSRSRPMYPGDNVTTVVCDPLVTCFIL